MLRLTNKHSDGETAAILRRDISNMQRVAVSVISPPIVMEESAILIILSYPPKHPALPAAWPSGGISTRYGRHHLEERNINGSPGSQQVLLF